MNPAQAAALWARVEAAMIRRGLLRDGRDLREQRAALVRVVGELEPDLPPGKPTPRRSKPVTVKQVEVVRAVRPVVRPAPTVSIGPSSASDSAVTAMLDRMLDQSCGRRAGYDGDDEVTYR